VLVSDFARFALYDLEPDEPASAPLFGDFRVATTEFTLAELHRTVHAFAFIPGYKQHKFADQDPINIKAVGIMGHLHDALKDGGYSGHKLERFLVRVLFCLFADDTGIFERDSFELYIQNHTKEDGSDLGLHLARLFDVLNTPEDQRPKKLDEDLASFRYVNGDLFAKNLGFADFDRDMRNALVACTRFDWSRISPAIFGSLFQDVMQAKERRQIGGHYTSERDILKVIRALFLDDLREEFERAKKNKSKLRDFHEKLAGLRFLDPACGCGNFLVISYRELRALEIEILKELYGKQMELNIDRLSAINVDAFYGIEISEWPARIAEVAMWLMDHQMNQRLSEAFGQYFVRLPLKKSPHIVCGNALRLDWKEVLPPSQCNYVLGNPPFVGKQFMTASQSADMEEICRGIKGAGLLDYVTAWYFKAAEYVQGTRTQVGFVSTNSITQGEQVGVLWNDLFSRYHIKILFAHRTFPWESEARGKAHVHVVIVGFGAFDRSPKRLYDYEVSGASATNEAVPDEQRQTRVSVSDVPNISPYLVAGPDVFLKARSKPLCQVPEIVFGSMPNDGGYLLFSPNSRETLLRDEPEAAKYLRRFVGADEFLNGKERWCLWLDGENSAQFMELRRVRDCVEAVAIHRKSSRRETTKKLAMSAAYFGEIRQPDRPYLLIPSVSSERRRYIPIGFMRPEVIASNLCLLVPGADLYHFGVLSSAMHMAWVRHVAGRLKSDYRYSNKIVYNNFPWPNELTAARRDRALSAAKQILHLRTELGDGRAGFLPARKKAGIAACLADLYGAHGMPRELVKAHAELDRAVDRCYRSQPFTSERQRVEFLFALYERLTTPLVASPSKTRRRSKTVAAQ
jgi:hypothetical protein